MMKPDPDSSPYDVEAPQPGARLPSPATLEGDLADPLFGVMGGKPMVYKVMEQERRQMLYNSAGRLAAMAAIMTGLLTLAAAEINACRNAPLDGHVAGKWGLLGFLAVTISYTAVRTYTVNAHNTEDKRNLSELVLTPVITIPVTMLLLAKEGNWKSVGDGFVVSAAAVGHIALGVAIAALGYFAKKMCETCRNEQPALDMYTDIGSQYEVTL
ncbi:MAG: hypothetical protein P1U34_08720 [Coxiellaceae bacterium]|nr:hypothetical protein [Coxiellaceae bacterium]